MTVRILNNIARATGSANLTVKIITKNSRRNIRKAVAALTANKNSTMRVLSVDMMDAFHEVFSHPGGSGPLGVWLSLALCESPRLYGFSSMKSDLDAGFVHYYRGSYGEGMLGNANVPLAVAWLHVLSCCGLVHLAH